MNYFEGLSFSMAGVNKTRSMIKTNHPQYYGIQFLQSGGIYLRIDQQKEYKFTEPAAFLTYPGRRFDYGPLEEFGCHYWICFHGCRIQKYIESGLFPMNPEKPLVRIIRMDKFLASITELIAFINAPDISQSRNRMVLLLEDILLQMYEQDEDVKKKIPVFQRPYFENLLNSLRKSPWKNWDFDAEAAGIHVSKNHFGRLFKDFSGFAPQEFLIKCRLALAAELLTANFEPVKAIASKVGIDNEFYFSRLFKKQYHLSPREYRRELTGK